MMQFYSTFSFLMTFMVASYAQKSGDVELAFGSGFNLANVVRVDGLSNTSNPRESLNLSISGEYFFSDRWGFKSKLVFDTKGWSDGFLIRANEDTTETTNINLNYITLPLMANWHFGSTRKWYLHFGPYVGFLISAQDSEQVLDLMDAFNKIDFGLAFGVGYKFKINERIKLYFEYDAQLGSSNIFGDFDGFDVRTARQSFNAGVILLL